MQHLLIMLCYGGIYDEMLIGMWFQIYLAITEDNHCVLFDLQIFCVVDMMSCRGDMQYYMAFVDQFYSYIVHLAK